MGNKQSSSNRKINKFYKLGKSIGQPGAFGHAVLATDKKTGETVAVKIINKDANLNMEDIIDERDLLVIIFSLIYHMILFKHLKI